MVGRQAGFSLIELILVVAIAAGLLTMILQGFASTRVESQFQDSIERLTENLIERRTEAVTNINAADPGAGLPANVNFGTMIRFTDGSDIETVMMLKTANNLSPAPGQQVYASTSTPIAIKWETAFHARVGHATCIAFTKSLTDASLRTTTFTTCPISAVLGMSYSSFTATGSDSFLFSDPNGGKQALINVDTSNNAISRTYQ